MAKYWIGCSGFGYDEWIGGFYPQGLERHKFLEYYARHFNTVEINTTFYNWPERRQVLIWTRKTPEYFSFSFKLPQDITHEKKLINASKDVIKFLDILSPVIEANKLGVILVQLPPSLRRDIKRLETFLAEIPHEKYKFAVEFRHESWLVRETFTVLSKYNVAYVAVDEPLLPPILEITANFTYIRFHGHGKNPWYFYDYKEEELKPWVRRIKYAEDLVNEIFIYFNNHFRAYAPKNAKTFIRLLGIKEEELVPRQKVTKGYATLHEFFA